MASHSYPDITLSPTPRTQPVPKQRRKKPLKPLPTLGQLWPHITKPCAIRKFLAGYRAYGRRNWNPSPLLTRTTPYGHADLAFRIENPFNTDFQEYADRCVLELQDTMDLSDGAVEGSGSVQSGSNTCVLPVSQGPTRRQQSNESNHLNLTATIQAITLELILHVFGDVEPDTYSDSDLRKLVEAISNALKSTRGFNMIKRLPENLELQRAIWAVIPNAPIGERRETPFNVIQRPMSLLARCSCNFPRDPFRLWYPASKVAGCACRFPP